MGLNLHGIVGVQSVQQIEEEEYEETVPKQAAPVKVSLHQDCSQTFFHTSTDVLPGVERRGANSVLDRSAFARLMLQ